MISRLIHIAKLLIKHVKVNDHSKLVIGQRSGIGRYSRILFSEQQPNSTSRIVIGNYAGTGRNCELHVWNNNSIIIKDHSTLNDGCKLLGDVTIEKYCVLSANIFASSGNHYAFEKPTWLIKDQDTLVLSTEAGIEKHSQPVHIEEDCWIGVGVFIKQGVYIGRGAVIGANSVVLKNVFPYSVIGGSPAKEIRKRFDFDPPQFIDASNELHLPYFYRGFEHKRISYEPSIKSGAINGGKELLITLGRTENFHELIIKGNRSARPLKYRVTLDDKYQWEFEAKDKRFHLHLTKENALASDAVKKEALYNSISEDVRKYHVVCMVSLSDGDEHSIGIENVEVK